MVACIGAGTLLVALIAFGIWRYASRDVADAESGAGGASGDFYGTRITSAPVVLDEPVSDAFVDYNLALAAGSPVLMPAETFDESKASQTAKTAATDDAGIDPTPKPGTGSEEPRWQAEVDPPPADAAYEIAAGLTIELTGINRQVRPTFADAHGPFALIPPNWKEDPYQLNERRVSNSPTGRTIEYVLSEVPPESQLPVVDLRTGQRVGEFDWHAPFSQLPALSPDGRHLVGPYHVPTDRLRGNLRDEAEEALKSLYLWRRDSEHPSRELKVPGRVSWYGFASDATLLVLVETPARQLQIWDVDTAEQRAAVELPSTWRSPFEVESTAAIQRRFGYPLAAASPGGRYVAVAGGEEVTMIAIDEARILGTLEVPKLMETDWWGISFSPDGENLLLAIDHPEPMVRGVRVMVFGAADGRQRMQRDARAFSRGPIYQSPDGRSCLIMGAFPPTPATAAFIDFATVRSGGLENVDQIVRLPATGPVLVANIRAGETISKFVVLERALFQEKLASLHGNPYPAIDFDRGSQKVVTVTAPATWQPVPPSSSPEADKCDKLVGSPWLTSLGDQHLGMFLEHRVRRDRSGRLNLYDSTALVRRIDRATGLPVGKPLALRAWDDQGEGEIPVRLPFFGMSPDGERFVIRGHFVTSWLELRTSDGGRQFGFAPFEDGRAVDWAEFATNQVLLAAGGGEITAWEVGPSSCKALYRVTGEAYTAPFLLTPDRKLLWASRGHSLDVLDVASGECRQRLGIHTAGLHIADLALAPDGKHLAALYTSAEAAADLQRQHYVSTDHTKSPMMLAVWDLATGTAHQFTDTVGEFAFVAWAGPEHVGLVRRQTHVFDLLTQTATLEYSGRSGALAKSRDGRLWHNSGSLKRGDGPSDWSNYVMDNPEQPDEPIWRLVSLTTGPTAEEAPYFASDREAFSLRGTPIRVELDLGNRDAALKHGQKILGELQRRGLKIGGEGNILRISPQITSSGSTLTARSGKHEDVPQVNYVWRILDAKGRVVWTETTTGKFAGTKSKYKEWGPNQTFNFGRTPMWEAIAREIMADGEGLLVPEQLPSTLLYSGGKFIPAPQKMAWHYPREERGESP